VQAALLEDAHGTEGTDGRIAIVTAAVDLVAEPQETPGAALDTGFEPAALLA
jgi:hypothetical protein